MDPSSFPQEINQANTLTVSSFQAILTNYPEFGVLRAVDNPFFRVYKL
jgi:hypothetical protein